MVEWAPLRIPLKRRLQTLTTLYMMCSIIAWYFGILAMLVYFPVSWFVLLPYFIYIYFDDATPSMGGQRKLDWVRNLGYLRYFRDYFPITLKSVMDKPIDANKNYIFLYHPHGFMALGAMGCFGSDTAGTKELFPGIDFVLVTLKMNLRVPFYREWLMAHGVIDASRQSIVNRLRAGPGKSLVLVPGGAAEALECHKGSCSLILANRKGFVKIAIREGASLVPMFAYGENDLFTTVDNPEGSRLRALQKWGQRWLGFSIPLVAGRGIFQYSYGLMPRRHAIDVVVGNPMHIEKVADPSKELVNEIHAKYLEHLTDLFESTKQKYPDYKDRTLRFI